MAVCCHFSKSILRVLIVVFSFVVSAQATSVIPPTFDELVRDSELILRGRVTAVRSGWSEVGMKPRIATWVTIAVERTLRGEAGAAVTLEFMGGVVGETRLEVAGWPLKSACQLQSHLHPSDSSRLRFQSHSEAAIR